MKARRQTKILELIKDKRIETQEELLNELRNQGYNVTQATVSRDIKELKLIKFLLVTETINMPLLHRKALLFRWKR